MGRIVVLCSGQGSNFQAIVQGVRSELSHQFEVVGMISDRKAAFALTRAQHLGVPAFYIPVEKGDFTPLLRQLEALEPTWICLAGYLRILPPWLVQRFPNQILNLHPSLLPAFPGLHAIAQALEAGVQWTGCTLHFVNVELDAGPILMQHPIPVLQGDTLESLSERVHRVEHLLYVELLRRLATVPFVVEKQRVRWLTRFHHQDRFFQG